jgi:two-component system response regulator YesN
MYSVVLVDDEQVIVDGLKVLLERFVPECEVIGCANDGLMTKFAILSGYSEFEYARKGMQLGVRYYLSKPIEESELQAVFRNMIRQIDTERQKEAELRPKPTSENSHGKKDVIEQIKQYVAEHYNESVSLADLSERFYINLHYLCQLFKAKTGQTYLEYLTKLRMEQAKELLLKSDLKIYEICERVGYSDTTHFSRIFEKTVGSKPTEYRKRLLR